MKQQVKRRDRIDRRGEVRDWQEKKKKKKKKPQKTTKKKQKKKTNKH